MDYTPGHRGPWDEAPRYLIRDRDRAYGAAFTHRLRAIGIRDKPIAPGSPWQNGFAERLIGSIRRECVDHIVVLGVRSISPCVDFWRRIRRMCAFRCGSTGHPLKSNTHLQSFACTGGDDAAILPLSVRPFGCRTCGGRSNSCRYQGDDLGGVFQCVRGSWSRV